MNGAGGQFRRERFLVNPVVFRFFLRRLRTAVAVILVHGVNRNETSVEQRNDCAVRERTRSHRERAPSTSSGVDSPIVREQKDRPIVLLCQSLGFADAAGPSDFIKAAFLRGRLQLLHALPHPGKVPRGLLRIFGAVDCDGGNNARRRRANDFAQLVHGFYFVSLFVAGPLNNAEKLNGCQPGRIVTLPPLRGCSPSPREGRAGRWTGRGVVRTELLIIGFPLSLPLSPLLRRGERGASRRTNVLSEHVIGNGYAKSTSSPDSVRAGSEGGG